MKANAFSWMVAVGYVICGAAIFHITPKVAAIFEGVDAPLPFTLRVVFSVGPWGLLTLALLGALLAIRFNSTGTSFFLAVALFITSIGIVSAVLFTGFDRPSIISPPPNKVAH